MDAQFTGFPHEHRDVSANSFMPLNQHFAMFLLYRLSRCLWARFQQTGNQQDLDWTIALERLMIDACPYELPGRWEFLRLLATFRSARYDRGKRPADLERAIVLWRDALAFCPQDHEGHSRLMTCLVTALYTRFEVRGKVEDLDEVIKLQRAVVALISEGHPDHPAALDLAAYLSTRFQYIGNPEDLAESIQFFRTAAAFLPEGHSNRSSVLYNLATSLMIRFKQGGSTDDLEEAIQLSRCVLGLRPRGHPNRFMSLITLATCLRARFKQNSNIDDLNEAVRLHRDALDLVPHGHPDQSVSLNNLANSLQTRFEHRGNVDDLNEAIRLHRDALALFPLGRSDRPLSLNNLADSLRTRFGLSGNVDDLDEAIRLHRDALALFPHGHPVRPGALNSLANSLRARFGQSGDADDLNEAVLLNQAALALHPHGDPNRPGSLSSLANSLLARFEQNAVMDDLNEAVRLHQEALTVCPHGHPHRSSSLDELATSLLTRFEHNGNADDLNEAVRLHRDALALFPHSHPSRPLSLNNLAASLQTRFKQTANVEDLNEAVMLNRAAVDFRPHGHPERPSSLNNLATSLLTRFGQNAIMDDLNEAIELHRDALALLPYGHPGRSLSLNNLAISLKTRFEHCGSVGDLDEAIRLHCDALALRSRDHPNRSMSLNNLADSLRTRFDQSSNVADLNEAVQLHRDALALRPHGHPDHSISMIDLAITLSIRFRRLGQAEDLEECIRLLSQAADHSFSATLIRLKAAQLWTSVARQHDHNTVLAAYQSAISLLQRALTIRPSLTTRHDMLNSNAGYKTLGVEAASCAIERGDLTAAIELLEQGRALLWSQMQDLRTPLDQLLQLNEPLAQRFRHVRNRLEVLMTSAERRSGSLGLEGSSSSSYNRRHDEERTERVRRLSGEQEELIGKIRAVPGFEDFLQSAPFEKLRQAAIEGPVVVVNHSQFRCDALIILPREQEPCVCVPLDGDWGKDAIHFANCLLTARHRYHVQSSEYDEVLRRVMKVLWDRVVSKVVQKFDDLGVAKGSRIWWCPTLFLSLLPFHAAGPYVGADGATKYLLDDYISSYTPTLTSLIAARAHTRIGAQKLLFVGDTKLPSTKKEYLNIRRHISVWKYLVDEKASRDSVLEALKRAEWVHFSCHGSLDQDKPFESSFVLPGGKLTLLDLSRAHLRNAEFAFLSACHTAEQSPGTAMGEALHLAAAMQCCGFRSVAGTMWQLLDRDAPILADAVYFHLMNDTKDGEVRFKGAAAAVREAALHLRRSQKEWSNDGKGVEIMAERWVNLVHIGA